MLIVVLVALATLIPSFACAQSQKAGVVTTLEGTVTVTNASLPQPRPLKFKDDVFVNDRVVTGDRSIARMLLGGKAVVTVRERSALTITEVPGKSTIALDSGKIAVAVAREKMKPGEEIEVRTPNAVAGVRGTVFVTEVTQAGAALDAQTTYTTWIYCLTGAVHVPVGNQIFTVLANTMLSRIGSQLPTQGALTADLRARAIQGLVFKTVPAGTAPRATNEQVYNDALSGLAGSTAAIGHDPGATSLLQAPQQVTAPILPGGSNTIPIPQAAPPPPPAPPSPPANPSRPTGPR